VTRLRWSALLTGLGALLLALGLLCGLANRHVLDGEGFAGHVDAIRTDPAVARQVGDLIVQRVVAANPDLVALRPLLQSTAAALVGSPAFGPVVRAATRDLHGAFTGSGDSGVVLWLADAVTVLTGVLPVIAPDLATHLPALAPVTLLDAPRGTAGARVARAVRTVGLLSWLLPLLAVGALAARWWLAPDRRRGAIRTGYGVVAAGVLVGLVAFVGAAVASRADEDTLRGALVAATWRELGSLVWTAAAVAVAAGVLLALAGSDRLPDLRTLLARTRAALTSRPTTRGGRVARGIGLVLLGVGIALRPLTALEMFGFLAGLMLVIGGLGELVPSGPSPKVSLPRRRRAVSVTAVAMIVPVAVLVGLVAVDAAPADRAVPPVASTSGRATGTSSCVADAMTKSPTRPRTTPCRLPTSLAGSSPNNPPAYSVSSRPACGYF
jgi:hypothetical protein